MNLDNLKDDEPALPHVASLASKLRRRDVSDDLIVVCSPSKKMAYWRSEFHTSVLFIAEQRATYYTQEATMTADLIKSVAEDVGARRVLLMGPSKGGFASLMLAKLLTATDKTREYSVLAFSPQTVLFPENPNLPFPSYKQLMSLSRSDPSVCQSVQKYGDASDLQNIRVVVVYGSRNKGDYREAKALSGSRLSLVSLPIAAHSSVLPFICDTTIKKDVAEVVGRLFAASKDQQDLTLLPRKQALVSELSMLPKMPTLPEVCLMVLDGDERALRRHARAAHARVAIRHLVGTMTRPWKMIKQRLRDN